MLDAARLETMKSFLRKLEERQNITPDINTLKFHKSVPLFVYGLEKTDGELWNTTLKGSKSLGKALTLDEKFVMQQTIHMPVVFKTYDSDFKKARIKGEVHLVSVERIIQHDHLNQNGRLFRRVNQRFMLYENKMTSEFKKFRDMPYVSGFMYVGNYPHWKDTHLRDLPKIRLPSVPKIKLYSFYEWSNPWNDDKSDLDLLWGSEYVH